MYPIRILNADRFLMCSVIELACPKFGTDVYEIFPSAREITCTIVDIDLICGCPVRYVKLTVVRSD